VKVGDVVAPQWEFRDGDGACHTLWLVLALHGDLRHGQFRGTVVASDHEELIGIQSVLQQNDYEVVA